MTALIEQACRVADELLGALPQHRRDTFAIRLQRWWPDLLEGLERVYGQASGPLALRLIGLAAAAYAERDPELCRLDEVRTITPDWLQSPHMLGYAAYTERFAGDLPGVGARIPYLRELGVTYLHLMPLLLPRDGDSDGGYAVADFRTVRPDLGTVADLRAVAAKLRAAGISLVLDLVLNHVAREHEWARAARAGSAKHRAYFRVFDDRELPDAYERTLPEVFPDFAPGNFTFDPDLDAWVWTTFNSWQWDVDWTNPEVFAEYADIVFFLANCGVEVLRLDAIAFLWKRLGTNSQNQPEVHAITQSLRALTRITCPAVAFKAEAIVGPADLVQYLGTGRHHGKVSDLAYHNSLMVQIWSMLAAGNVRLASRALRALPPIPSTTAWVTYVRCHDDVGWAIDDGDAAAAGLAGWSHRSFLSDWYSGNYPTSTAQGLVFQENPATGDRRISGTAAALTGIQAAEFDRPPASGASTSELDEAIAKFLLAHTIVAGWGGVPVIWSGDELASPNDPDWAIEPGHEGDNRWSHRPRLDPARVRARLDPTTVAGRVFTGLRRLALARTSLEHLQASVATEILDFEDPGILPAIRRHPVGDLLCLYNVTSSWRSYPGYWLRALALDHGLDALAGEPIELSGDDNLWLPPYAARWIIGRSEN